MFRVSTATVARWVRDGKLGAVRTPSGRNLFRAEDVDAFTRARAELRLPRSEPRLSSAERRRARGKRQAAAISRQISERIARELAESLDASKPFDP